VQDKSVATTILLQVVFLQTNFNKSMYCILYTYKL